MDQWVLNSQQWVNAHYGSVSGYTPAPENGITGWSTMYALTRALQHELGISALSDNFGPTTLSYLTSQFPTISSTTQNTHPNVAALIQCAMWCHGYWGGTTLGSWDSLTVNGVTEFNSNAGIGSASSLAPKAVKALFGMDAYVTVNSGSSDIRTVQQWLNGHYLNRRDYYVIPCDGHYSRGVQRGLVYAIQYELGMADGVANGNLGPATKAGLQSTGTFGTGQVDGSNNLVRLFQGALLLNSYSAPFDGSFDSMTSSLTSSFQSFSESPVTGAADYPTWAGLLVSTGDPDRSVTAADMSTILTSSTASDLHAAGYRTVLRYLSVTGKGLAAGETDVIFNAGLNLSVIFQEYNNAPQYFSYAIGNRQGFAAALRARQLGIKAGAVIWFPVDYDFTDDEITALIFPYFEGVKDAIGVPSVSYVIGVYGARNVCARIVGGGYASTSWIAGMSTGWSGNLGFALPSSWSYQQIKNLTRPNGLAIDNDVAAVGAPALTASNTLPTPAPVQGGVKSFDQFFWWMTQLDQGAEISQSNSGNSYDVGTSYEIVSYWVMQLKADYLATKFQLYVGLESSNAVQDSYQELAGMNLVAPPIDYYYAHWGVAYRGHLHWGLPTNSGTMDVSEEGGWAFDLVTLWNAYVDAQAGGQNPGSIYDWFYDGVGDSENFGLHDLMADIDGYNIAHMVSQTYGRLLSDALREQQLNNLADPRWRFQYWYSARFGSNPVTLKSAVEDVFTSSAPWIHLPYDQIANGRRRPGEDQPVGDPNDAVDELDELSRAFVDKIVLLTTDANPSNVGN